MNKLKIGSVLTAPQPQSNYLNAIVEGEKGKPTNSPSRSIAFFAADSPEKSYLYAEKEYGSGSAENIEVYKIKMRINYKAPMCLIHQVEKIN